MIKILHYGISQNRGGIETYLNKLWSNIDKKNFHFDFIDTNLENPCFYEDFSKLGSNFYKITHRNISITKNKKDLQALFKTKSFDILHCHLNTLSYIEPVKVALQHGCKVIVHSRSAGASNSVVTNVFHKYHSLTLPRKDIKMVAVSDLAGKWLFGKDTKYDVINNGVDTNYYKFSFTERMRVRKELGVEGKFVIGNIGAFLPAKNHSFIIDIISELVKKKTDVVLLLVGKGPREEEIINLVNKRHLQENVKFLGARTDISSLLSAMDFFLFPSVYEGFPNAVLEAQTSGLPCLISDVITNEVIITEHCNQLSLNLSPVKWANSIINSEQIPDRSIFCKIVSEAGCSVQEEIVKIENLYQNILKDR